MKAGLCIAIFYLPQTQDITVGRLGTFSFQDGYYFFILYSACTLRYSIPDESTS